MNQIRRFTRLLTLLAAVVALVAASATTGAGEPPSPEKERELLAILRSDAPKSEKAIACKHLAVHGSKEAVADLAKLLTDEQLASWARIALEAIPGPEADEAFRNSLGSLQGKLLVGAINSIGVRRDAGSVEVLSGRLHDGDVEVASAAAVALGHVGNADAAKSLRQSLGASPVELRSAAAEGLVLCAERSLVDGDAAQAVAIYDEIRKADVPRQRILEATRGAILARKDEGIALLMEQFQSPDKDLFQIALSTAREFPGNDVDEALATELSRAKPERAALVIQAMADRRETVILAAILKAAGAGPKEVRLAAVGALGRVGDASCLSQLLKVAIESDSDLAETAKTALADLPGDAVNNEIVAQLASAEGEMYPVLIELVGQRRIAAVEALVKALGHSDAEVRQAALTSLGATVAPNDLVVLIGQVVSSKHREDAEVAQQALKTACIRMPDREACAADLAAALERSPLATKVVLLDILGEVGGTKSLATIGEAARSNDDRLQDAASRLLGKWMTVDAGPVLLDLAKTGPGDKYQVRAVRGYLRIARQFTKSEQEKLEMCRNALEVARQPAEQKLVVEILGRIPTLDALQLADKLNRENRDVHAEATQAMLAIASKLGDQQDKARDILSKADLHKPKLEIVKAEYGAEGKQKDVTDVIKKQSAGSQFVSLAGGYNETFGGDPAPGVAKQLKIQYQLEGKAGEATFAENALVVLPVPKSK